MEKQAREEGDRVELRRQWRRVLALIVIGALVIGAGGFVFNAFWKAHVVNLQTEGRLSWTSELVNKENTPGNVGGRAPGLLLS